jgi:1-pyrroline-5-carboxylate dehydrogenase
MQLMSFGSFRPPVPVNEAPLDYAPGSPEREQIVAALQRIAGERIAIPHVIGGSPMTTNETFTAVMPHRHSHVLADVSRAEPEHVQLAIDAALAAAPGWSETPWEERAAVFLRAADLLTGPWRSTLNAATMLNQSKTVQQSEIEAACELADFLRFNVHYLSEIYDNQPISPRGVWNRTEYRPLEGFVFAVSPFNFTAIGGNLSSAPALMGNTVVWKPASTATLAAHYLMELFRAAGLPDGVINLVYGSGSTVGNVALCSPDLAGIHFTGSTSVFQHMWQTVGAQLPHYRSYPRLVGETGGKDFVAVHASADVGVVATALIRGAFEYQGQKCSAASRAYIPSNLWPALREHIVAEVSSIRVGDVADLSNFMGAVIDAPAFATQKQAIEEARRDAEIVVGGGYDDSEGWFVDPTVVRTEDPKSRLMREELFGPILTLFVYDERKWTETLRLVDSGSAYALTGSVIANDRAAITEAHRELRNAAGNFYVNDKPTGAVVGQQPFGGARASGTNDKAGSVWNLLRWTSVRSIKETFNPPADYRYPYMR